MITRKMLVFLPLIACVMPALASRLDLAGGTFVLNGELHVDLVIQTDGVLVGDGVLHGNVSVSGVVSPGDTAPGTVGALTFDGTLTFLSGSVFRCHAAADRDTDTITATGQVAGDADVSLSHAPGAEPTNWVIIAASTSSDYSGFTTSSGSPGGWSVTGDGNGNLVLNASGSADLDGDGLPDWWERQYFTGATNAVADVDDDKDGLSNYDEFIAGTHPRNIASVFRLTNVRVIGADEAELRWTSAPGRVYDLLVSTTLDGIFGRAPVVTGVSADPPENVYTNETRLVGPRFYGVRVRLP